MPGDTILPFGGNITISGGRLVSGKGVIESDSGYQSYVIEFGEPQAIEPIVPTTPQMTLYSQNDPRWKYKEYAPGYTFGAAGCYVTCVAMVASLTGSIEEPPQVADELRRVGCFNAEAPELLSKPNKIPEAYPGLGFYGWYDWHKTAADTALFFAELAKGPVFTEVDFRPTTKEFNQHVVVALEWDEAKNDLVIADPWDGTRCYLLERYKLVWYSLGDERPFESAICGMRLLRLKD